MINTASLVSINFSVYISQGKHMLSLPWQILNDREGRKMAKSNMSNSFLNLSDKVFFLLWKEEGSEKIIALHWRKSHYMEVWSLGKESSLTLSCIYSEKNSSVRACMCVLLCGVWLPRLVGDFYKSTHLLRVSRWNILAWERSPFQFFTFCILKP